MEVESSSDTSDGSQRQPVLLIRSSRLSVRLHRRPVWPSLAYACGGPLAFTCAVTALGAPFRSYRERVNLEFADELWSDGAAHEPVATKKDIHDQHCADF